MADQKRIWRLGIDVGGTNTDAVVIDGDLKLVAATKSPTTEDVMSGIVAAMHEVITQIGADAARNIGFAMLGTTHCTNAIVERKRLNKVAALRVGAPATTAISCMADWPDELKNAMRVRDFLVHGRARRARRGLRVRGRDQRVLAGVRRAREARRRRSARGAGRGLPHHAVVGDRVARLPRARERVHPERGAVRRGAHDGRQLRGGARV